MNEWSLVGAVRVRFTKMKVGKIPVKQPGGSVVESDRTALMVWIEVQNLSPVRKLDYRRWHTFTDDVSIMDEHGNKYGLEHEGFERVAIGESYATVQPEGQVHADVLFFEPPVKPATVLMVKLPPLVKVEKGQKAEASEYRFKIPAAAWK